MTCSSDSQIDRALGFALKMLRARDRFSNEVRAALQARKFPEKEIANTLDYLVHKRLLRDDIVAEDFAHRAVSSKPWGPLRIRLELERRLAPAESIERALSLIPRESDLLQRALAKLGTLPPAKLARRLSQYGFSDEAIGEAIDLS